MKYIKTYESINTDQPRVGDYVLCNENASSTVEYTRNNVGKIIFYIDDDISNQEKYQLLKDYRYIVQYEYTPNINIPMDDKFFRGYCRRMSIDEIIYWSENKEDLEAILNSKKYNL